MKKRGEDWVRNKRREKDEKFVRHGKRKGDKEWVRGGKEKKSEKGSWKIRKVHKR